MSLEVITNIIFSATSSLLCIISVVIVVITLRQNTKMLEASTRPYISAYLHNEDGVATLVIKNYGNSSAEITSFYTSVNFANLTGDTAVEPFKSIVGFSFAPHQTISTVFSYRELSDAHNYIDLSIGYSSGHKRYKEEISINLLTIKELFQSHTTPQNDKELSQIASSLKSINKKLI